MCRINQTDPCVRPIAFHPASIIFDTPNHAVLLEKVGVKEMINDVVDELLRLAEANGCKFASGFKENTIREMSEANHPESIMWQDYMARRPMEVETYLGSPMKLARESQVPIPRIETLYAILYHLNIVNRNRPRPGDPNSAAIPPGSPTISSPVPPRMPSRNGHRPMMSGTLPPNGNVMPGMPGARQPRPRNSSNLSQTGGMLPGMRRGAPPGMNGGPPNGYGRGHPPPHMGPHMNGPPHMNGGSRGPSRRGSMDGNDLEEFSHLLIYDNIPEGSEPSLRGDPSADLALREREIQLRQRELALREQEMRVRRGPPPGPRGGYRGGPPRGGPHNRGPHPMRHSQQVFDDDDDDDDDFIDMMSGSGTPTIDPDNFDMMSVTSRKNRKAPGQSPGQFRSNPDGPPPARGGRFRPNFTGRNRSSQIQAPMPTDNIMDDPLMSCSSNRYGSVDRGAMGAGSRANSLTASRLEELQYGQAPPGPPGPPSMSGAYPRNRQMLQQRDANGW